jgi:hypothetical protein
MRQAVQKVGRAIQRVNNPAAGGVIRKQDWEIFKANLLVESEKVVNQRLTKSKPED